MKFFAALLPTPLSSTRTHTTVLQAVSVYLHTLYFFSTENVHSSAQLRAALITRMGVI